MPSDKMQNKSLEYNIYSYLFLPLRTKMKGMCADRQLVPITKEFSLPKGLVP